MGKVCFNGQLVDSSQPYLDATNRCFRYGDGLFESIRVVDGVPFNLENHYKRLSEGLKVLRIKMPLSLSLESLNEKLLELIKANDITGGGKLRLTVYRGGNGTYVPSNMSGEYLIECESLPSSKFTLNEKGISVDIFDEIQKPVNPLAPFKSCNGLLYITASVSALESGLDDALLMNASHNIIEATSSNLFIVSNGVLYTPTIEDGCVGGTFRMFLINLAIENNIKVYECSLTPQNLLAAEEIFLTNSIAGIRWVGSYKTKRYYNDTARRLLYLVNESIAANSAQDSQET